jgi:hypothetical protein
LFVLLSFVATIGDYDRLNYSHARGKQVLLNLKFMKKLEIEIPDDKEIDWEASAKQKQIVFKDKQLTYEDVCKELFKKEHYFTDVNGLIIRHTGAYVNDCPNNATTKHQLECILAKNKLANVARYLNGEWTKKEQEISPNWVIYFNPLITKKLIIDKTSLYSEQTNIVFKYTYHFVK